MRDGPVSSTGPGGGRSVNGIILGVAAAFLAAPALAQDIDPKADEVLRAMSSYMAGLQTFSVTADSSTEIMLADGRKIQLTATSHSLIDRTRGLRMTRDGPRGGTTLVFDGSQASIASARENVHLTLPVAGGIDGLLDEVRAALGTEALGGSDLLYSDPYAGLMLDVETGEHLGQAWVGGVLTDHLSFRTPDIDWQIWVRSGAEPAPVKYVITSKWITGAPQFSVQLSDFVTPVDIAGDAFAFVPDEGSRAITPDELPDLDLLAEE